MRERGKEEREQKLPEGKEKTFASRKRRGGGRRRGEAKKGREEKRRRI